MKMKLYHISNEDDVPMKKLVELNLTERVDAFKQTIKRLEELITVIDSTDNKTQVYITIGIIIVMIDQYQKTIGDSISE